MTSHSCAGGVPLCGRRGGALLLAAGANKDGVISGNCPEVCYPIDYALLWYTGALQYYRISGDIALLRQLRPAADKCMGFLRQPANTSAQGLKVPAGCSMVALPAPRCDEGGCALRRRGATAIE